MKKIRSLLFVYCLILIVSCNKTNDDIQLPPLESEFLVFLQGQLSAELKTITGEVDTDYEVFPLVHASIIGKSVNGDTTLSIALNDDDENLFPFKNNGIFNVGGTSINASVTLVQGNTTTIANTGSVTITQFERTDNASNDFIKLSGTFVVSDGTLSISGTFTNIILPCGECE